MTVTAVRAAATQPADTGADLLTPRELEVVRLLACGYTAHRMGRMLSISPRTIRKHLEHVYQKLNCHDRLLVVIRAQELGLLDG